MEEAKIECSCPACKCKVYPSLAYMKWGRVYCSKVCTEKCTPERCFCDHEECKQGAPWNR